jgi:cytochrome P450
MFPSVSLGMQRHPPDEGLELIGKLIPTEYRVSMNPAVVHFDKVVFDEDANEFRPERWLHSKDKTRTVDKTMLEFGAGTRTCTGQNVR